MSSPATPPPSGPTPRWKMLVVNFLAAYPTLLVLITVVSPRVAQWPRPLSTALVGGLMSTFLTYVAVPRLNQLFAGWLHPR